MTTKSNPRNIGIVGPAVSRVLDLMTRDDVAVTGPSSLRELLPGGGCRLEFPTAEGVPLTVDLGPGEWVELDAEYEPVAGA